MAEIGMRDHRQNRRPTNGISHQLPPDHKVAPDPRQHTGRTKGAPAPAVAAKPDPAPAPPITTTLSDVADPTAEDQAPATTTPPPPPLAKKKFGTKKRPKPAT